MVRDCPARPGNTDWPAEAWPLPPLITAIYRAVPFLAMLPPWLINAGGPEMAAATGARVREDDRDCVLCGQPATAAIVVTPRTGPDQWPRWADLCAGCFGGVRAEALTTPGSGHEDGL